MSRLLGAFLVVALGCTAACKKKKSPTTAAETTTTTAPTPEPEPEAAVEDPVVAELKANFARVHFELDSASLGAGSMDVLEMNAKILQEHTDIRVRIEGHADERGTVDYNLALAGQRAKKVEDALLLMGVASTSLSTVSFGEEKPLVEGATENAFSKNRRAEFRVMRDPTGNVDSSNDNPVEP